MVHSMGLLLAVVVTAAKLTSKGCRSCCAGSSSGEAGLIGCGSSGATGPMGGHMLFEWVLEQFHCMLEVLERPRGHGFRLVSRRWVVERTLAWISRCRRLSQDDEKLPRTWETFIYQAMIELMLKRLAETLATSKTPSE